jgi:hypothetical protein
MPAYPRPVHGYYVGQTKTLCGLTVAAGPQQVTVPALATSVTCRRCLSAIKAQATK